MAAERTDLRQIRVVLWDAVGTLIFPHPPVADVYCRVGRRYGSNLSREQVQAGFAAALAKWSDCGPTDESREIKRWRSIVRDVLHDVATGHEPLFCELWEHFARPEAWQLFDDVNEAWSAFERRGIVAGMASNFDGRLEVLCRHLPPLDRSAHVFCSSKVGYPKPRLEFFETVRRRLSVASHEILLVGDDPVADAEEARAAGWQAVLLNRRGTAGVRGSIASLNQLLDQL